MNLGLVTLGCSKNRVDSEMLLSFFKQYGFNIVNDPEKANVIVVNTCGFIESAKKEAIETILEMADYKKNGICNTLIVTGCLAKRYKNDILENMPEVDLCIGVDEYKNIDSILSSYFNQKCLNHGLQFSNRMISTKFPLAYVRISDGCDNRCSYCAIPFIRGNHKSRYMEDILSEVEDLVKYGISEICLIAQDTCKYGLDIYGELKLAELINKVSKIEGVKWIRILYMYLYEVTDELILEIKNNDKVCKYFDVPIQHISDKMLKNMNRHDTNKIIFDTITNIKEKIPDAVLRTTVIVGFPGESQDDFNKLIEGIKKIKFDRLGAYTYSQEEGTKSFEYDGQIKEKVKDERLKQIYDIQKEISYNKSKERIGKEYEVIVEDVSEDDEFFVCRSMFEAPDVDGRIYVKIDKDSTNKVIIGEYTKVKIIDCNEYDLFAKVI